MKKYIVKKSNEDLNLFVLCNSKTHIVIGNISTHAKWIKYGYELDEEEILRKVRTIEFDPENEGSEYNYYYPKGDVPVSSIKLDIGEEFIGEDPIKIKCPCCGTFK